MKQPWLTALPLALWAIGQAAAQADERQRLQAGRERIQQEFVVQEAACQKRFAITDCMEDTRARRRRAMEPLRQRELALDAADRQRRAQERHTAIQAKAHAASAAEAAPPPVQPRVRKAPVPAKAARPASAPPPDPVRAAEAARRMQEASKRQAEARAAQLRMARRQAEKTQAGKASQPLPVPEPASGPHSR